MSVKRIEHGCVAIELDADTQKPERCYFQVNESILLTPNPLTAQALIVIFQRLLERTQNQDGKNSGVFDSQINEALIQARGVESFEWNHVDALQSLSTKQWRIWLGSDSVGLYLTLEEVRRVIADFEKCVGGECNMQQLNDITYKQPNIQKAANVDAQDIAEVHIRSWRETYEGLVPDSVLENLSVSDRTEKWAEILKEPDHGVLKLLVEGKIVGFSHSTKSNDADAKEGVADVHAIYLDPEMIGKGLGRKLMDQTLEALRSLGFSEATVWVMDVNKQAIEFYKAAGFADDNRTQPYELSGGHTVKIERYRRVLAAH